MSRAEAVEHVVESLTKKILEGGSDRGKKRGCRHPVGAKKQNSGEKKQKANIIEHSTTSLRRKKDDP